MNQFPSFSVIIPHKNTFNLLLRCIKSIPRTDDIQVIVIDDNSSGDIVDFCRLNKLSDSNIELYLTKEGKGAGYARNIGLKYAKGRWILFADADDFFIENAFDCFSSYIDSSEEIIFFKSKCNSNTGFTDDRAKYYNERIDDYNNEKESAEDYLRYQWGVPWAKMFKKTLLDKNDILFDEIKYSNDVMFSIRTGHYASSIKAINNVVYTVTNNKGSLINVCNFEAYRTRYIVMLKRNIFLFEIGKEYMQTSSFNRLIRCLIQYGPLSFISLIKLNVLYHINPFGKIIISRSFRSLIHYLEEKKEKKTFFSKSYTGDS